MPKYEYRCPCCGNEFLIEHIAKIKLKYCGWCGEDNLERVIGFTFGKLPSVDSNNAQNRVRNHIEEAKEEVKRQKQEMRKEYE